MCSLQSLLSATPSRAAPRTANQFGAKLFHLMVLIWPIVWEIQNCQRHMPQSLRIFMLVCYSYSCPGRHSFLSFTIEKKEEVEGEKNDMRMAHIAQNNSCHYFADNKIEGSYQTAKLFQFNFVELPAQHRRWRIDDEDAGTDNWSRLEMNSEARALAETNLKSFQLELKKKKLTHTFIFIVWRPAKRRKVLTKKTWIRAKEAYCTRQN